MYIFDCLRQGRRSSLKRALSTRGKKRVISPHAGADERNDSNLENPRYPARVRVMATRIVARDPEGEASLHLALEATADPEVHAELSALLRARG